LNTYAFLALISITNVGTLCQLVVDVLVHVVLVIVVLVVVVVVELQMIFAQRRRNIA